MIIFGDGRTNAVTMAGDKLKDVKAVEEVGKGIPLPSPVRDTHKELSKKIFRFGGRKSRKKTELHLA